MTPLCVLTPESADQTPETLQSENSSPTESGHARGRILYCRKCEGHGQKTILKDHAPRCPYILCTCKSCERLNQKRLKSFNKRNKEKLLLAAELGKQRQSEEETLSRKTSTCSTSNNSDMDSETNGSKSGLEGRSMSLGAMTVMSYDIWKAKCAAETKRLAANGKLPTIDDVTSSLGKPVARKRAHTFIAKDNIEIPKLTPPNVNQKKGRYVLLPTIPAMRVFVDEASEKPTRETSTSSAQSASMHAPVPSTSGVQPRLQPTMSLPAPVAQASVFNGMPSLPQSMTQTSLSSAPLMAPALSMMSSLPQPAPISYPPMTNCKGFLPPTTAAPPILTPEQILSLINPSLLLQNNLIQQQTAALQQLLSLSNVTVSSPVPDVQSFVTQPPVSPPKNNFAEELIKSLLAQASQPVFPNMFS